MKNEKKDYKEPFTIAIIDLLDAYHYADVFDSFRYKIVGDNYHLYN